MIAITNIVSCYKTLEQDKLIEDEEYSTIIKARKIKEEKKVVARLHCFLSLFNCHEMLQLLEEMQIALI